MHAAQPSSFLALPRELRDEIYRYLLPYRTSIRMITQPKLGWRSSCRQVWAESSELLYGCNEIIMVEGIREIEQSLVGILPLAGKYIRTLHLRPHFLDLSCDPHVAWKERNKGGPVAQPCQNEIRRVILLLQSLPRLRVLEIRPYGATLVDMVEPMKHLYQDLALLAEKQSLEEMLIKIRLSEPMSVFQPCSRAILRQVLKREPLAEEIPDRNGFSKITKLPSN